MISNISEKINDDGKRMSYGEGNAIREPSSGKGRYDLISPFAIDRLAKWMELGADKYTQTNTMYLNHLSEFIEWHINQCIKERRHLYENISEMPLVSNCNIEKDKDEIEAYEEDSSINDDGVNINNHIYVFGKRIKMSQLESEDYIVSYDSSFCLLEITVVKAGIEDCYLIHESSVSDCLHTLKSILSKKYNIHFNIIANEVNDEKFDVVTTDGRNWEHGMPFSRYIDSAKRHLNKFVMGMEDEDHLAAAAFNIFAIMHHQEMNQNYLDDMPHYL